MKNNVKAERIAANITQVELAKKLGVSRQTVISMESDKYIPSTLLALKLAHALGKKVEDLFSLEYGD